MSASDKVFAGSIPKIYDAYFVPLIFGGYAEDLASRVAALNPDTVLETAAGTGAVTRALATKLGPKARYTVTDLNPPMLEVAKASLTGDTRITWRQADALALPFGDDAFDAACCQFGVMFFPDRVKGYREARRVLKPGGRFVFNVWDRIEENEFANEVTNALAEVFAGDPPKFMARTPHGYHDDAVIRSELGTAGFSDITIERRTDVSHAPSARDAAIAYCQGSPLRNEIEARGPDMLERATELAAAAIAKRHGDGAVEGKIQAFVVSAMA
ncbi:MAG: class I SAM-dependent methyltransferase [Hyphomicrobiaceae bacterium]